LDPLHVDNEALYYDIGEPDGIRAPLKVVRENEDYDDIPRYGES
jgi:hypothetical protein